MLILALVLKTVLKLSSSWCGPGAWAPWIPVPGTWTVCVSMRAELSNKHGICLHAHSLSFLPLPTPFCSGFCFLCSLQWETAITRSLRSEHSAVPMVDTLVSPGKHFFQRAMSSPGQVMQDNFKGPPPKYFAVRIFTKHVTQIFCSHHRGG